MVHDIGSILNNNSPLRAARSFYFLYFVPFEPKKYRQIASGEEFLLYVLKVC